MDDYEQLSVGDYVTIRLRDGMSPNQFGGRFRFGEITGFGLDVLEAELMIELDDGQPPVYVSYIEGLARIQSPARVATSGDGS